MRKLQIHKVRDFATRHKRPLTYAGIGLFAVLMLAQVFYPGSRMPLFATIDGVNVSAWKKEDAAWKLNQLSREQDIAITLGKSDDTYAKVSPEDIGLEISYDERIESSSYPWYLRIVPTSLFWFGPLQAEKTADYTSSRQDIEEFLKSELGDSCNIPAKDASLKLNGDKLELVPAVDGGTCKQSEAVAALGEVKPVVNEQASVTIPVEVSTPKVDDDAAKQLAYRLNTQSADGIALEVAGSKQTIEQKEVLSWLVFKSKDNQLTYEIDAAKASPYLSKNVTPKIAKPAGVTKVTTLDFTETARANGATGQTLGTTQTLAGVKNVLDDKAESAKAVSVSVTPKIEYTRSYTKTSTGIAALMQHYAEDHPGTFGVSFTELGGRGLNANYNASKSFITASTYKLFVAYSALKRVEKGEWKWSDDVAGGRNLSTCFDDMIVKSDNACAEAMYKKIGYQKVINEARALGLSNTTLSGDGQRTSAGDLATFLTKLENKTIGLKDESRSRLISAMKRNVYRQGIPAGASGTVADKVGFLNRLLHDASVVYSPKGTYVLVVMTDGSTWGNIAELTRKIEALR